MATDAGGQTQRLIDIGSDSDSSGNASRSSDIILSAQGPSAVCQWRTPRFYEQECSRYFDCPSHMVDRVLSDAGDADDQDREEHQGSDMEDSEGHPDPGAVSPLSEDGDLNSEEGGQRPRSPSPDLPVRASGREQTGEHPPVEGESPRQSVSGRNPIIIDSSSAQVPRELESQSHGAGNRTTGTMETSITPRQPENLVFAQQQQQQPAQIASAQFSNPLNPLSRGQQPPFQGGASSVARPSEFVLPRWQPDAEATYCFICRTQFSIFVRKHHCRYASIRPCFDDKWILTIQLASVDAWYALRALRIASQFLISI